METIALGTAAFVGGLIMFLAWLPHGLISAIALAPIGGSLAALIMITMIAARNAE